jgi:chloride channel protein, CIC family
VIMRSDLQQLMQQADDGHMEGQGERTVEELVKPNPVVAYLDDTMRVAVNRMTETGYTRMPVVDRRHPDKLMGMVALQDLLKARLRNLEEERHRERILRIHILIPGRGVGRAVTRPIPEPDVKPTSEIGSGSGSGASETEKP